MTAPLLLAAALLTFSKGGIDLTVESETTVVDPGRPVIVTVTLKTARGVEAAPPDLRDRVRGFSLAEENAGDPETLKDGSVVRAVEWKLVPEPCADVYKIAPFVVGSFWAGPVRFEAPAAREAVTGGIETDPKKDLPPLSWRLVGRLALALAAAAALVALVVFLLKTAVRKVKEHRMSPIERAWVELDRLIRRGLPGRGRYKDFYVELTMVVRRYIQRKYGVKAPHLTTEEFLASFGGRGETVGVEELRRFLESADLVKFAGVEATPEMADEATESARGYLKGDASAERKEAAR